MKIRFEIILAVFVLAIAAMLLVPLPTPLIDVLIVLNLAFSFLILLVSLYLPNALSLLSFPTLLLLSTLFRLALNVASSRLILSQGDAGVVIEAFGTLLVGGQVAVGIIIFTIITVVNFLVIARGSARVSEVAARFALDAMPGKQATIDSDLRAGLITTSQAQQRRDGLRKESQLYGAMDGSMKFVQGDAVAGFVIILTNIVGGLTIALSQGVPLADAFQTYTILTVGDGLVAQVPALLIAICAGIVVTRVSSTDTSTLGEDVAADLFARPAIVIAVGGLLGTLSLLPGVPALPFLAVALTLVGIGYRMRARRLEPMALDAGSAGADGSGMIGRRGELGGGNTRALPAPGMRALPGLDGLVGGAADVFAGAHKGHDARLKILLDRHALFSSFERNLSSAYARWKDTQTAIESELGVSLPDVWIGADVRSPSGTISVDIDGISVCRLRVPLDATIASLEPAQARALGLTVISECIDPLTGKALSWISVRAGARSEAFVRFDALDLAMRHACHYLLSHPEDLITIADTHAALLELEKSYPGLFDSSLDRRFINPARASEIKRELLRAGIAVGDTRQLIEDLAHYCATYAKSELSPSDFDLSDIVAHVRKLRIRHIAGSLAPTGSAATSVAPAVCFGSDLSAQALDSSGRDLGAAVRSGNRPVCGILPDEGFITASRAMLDRFPNITWLSHSEARAAELPVAHIAVVLS